MMQDIDGNELEEVTGGYIFDPRIYNPLSDPDWMARNDIDYMDDPLNR